ncbi:four helix bundle protein [bacterium]|nr:four helix bundle protein [bacterium]
MNYNEIFRQRTKAFALSIIKELMQIKYDDALGIMRKQIIRSSTSVAANYRAFCRARSKREKYAKMCIVVEEADETAFWLEMLHEAGYLNNKMATNFYPEAEEIVKVMGSYKYKLEKDLIKNQNP